LNCFTPVCWAVLVRLNGGNRLVSTYGAKLAVPPAGAPGELGAGEGDVDGGALGEDGAGVGAGEDGGADGVGAGLLVGAGLVGAGLVGAGLLVGAGPPDWQEAPLIRQADGWPAGPEEAVTNPTDCELPGAIWESQPSAITVTVPPVTVDEPFHRLDSRVPDGSVKDRVQPETAAGPPLVIVYWPV
jgi:hypothetical protein